MNSIKQFVFESTFIDVAEDENGQHLLRVSKLLTLYPRILMIKRNPWKDRIFIARCKTRKKHLVSSRNPVFIDDSGILQQKKRVVSPWLPGGRWRYLKILSRLSWNARKHWVFYV